MMKYIMWEIGGIATPFLFPVTQEHAIVAKKLETFGKPVSAGYVSMNYDNELRIGGDSLTLNLKPRESDAADIQRWLKSTR
jgi:hypothetical protein